MPAGIWNIVLEEGSDFDLVVVYEDTACSPVDLTGYGARIAVRNNPDQPALLVGSVTGGEITIAGTTGQITVSIAASVITALKDLVKDNAEYNLTIWPGASTPSVNPKRLLEGCVEYSRNYGGA